LSIAARFDIADIMPDMTDRFELEVDTAAANAKWDIKIEQNPMADVTARSSLAPIPPPHPPG
jgi:3-ketosteroid 9alpha-monooxygenase subunit A